MHFTLLNLSVLGTVLLMLAIILVTDQNEGEQMRVRRGHGMLRQVIRSTLLEYENSTVFSAFVPIIIIMVLPGAALLNAVLGGSSFLLLCYLAIFCAVIGLLLFGECAWFGGVRSVVSGLSALSLMVLLPLYAVWSLTVHIQKSNLAQAALASIAIAAILAAAIAGAWTLFVQRRSVEKTGPAMTFFATMLFALSPAYIVFWFVLWISSVFEHDIGALRTWPDLLAFELGACIGFALFMTFLDKLVPVMTQGRWLPAALSAGLGGLVYVTVLALV
ncbi:MAG: hypothetical protein WD075_04625 [Rhodospirillales bacterium]